MGPNGYPTQFELDKISKWKFDKNNVRDFLELVRSCWNYADFGGFVLSGKNTLWLELHTYGWSGNEDVIIAMQNNYVFWFMCWEKHVRGGHYWFRIRLKSFE